MLKDLLLPHFVSGIICISLWEFIILLKLNSLKNIFWLFTFFFLIGESKGNLESRDLGERNMSHVSSLFSGEMVLAFHFH